jgi:hypothetical protein
VAGALERSAQRQQEQQQGFAPPPLDRLDGGALRTQLFATPKPQANPAAAAGSSAVNLLGTSPIGGLLEGSRGAAAAAAGTPGADWAVTPGPGACCVCGRRDLRCCTLFVRACRGADQSAVVATINDEYPS